jgi:mannose-6-phosphate isomerase-like protein (cupin superfamily)
LRFGCEDAGEVELRPGDGVYWPPSVRHREVAYSYDLELLEITLPADIATGEVQVPSAAGTTHRQA